MKKVLGIRISKGYSTIYFIRWPIKRFKYMFAWPFSLQFSKLQLNISFLWFRYARSSSGSLFNLRIDFARWGISILQGEMSEILYEKHLNGYMSKDDPSEYFPPVVKGRIKIGGYSICLRIPR